MVARYIRIIDAWDPILRRAFLASIAVMRNSAQFQSLVQAIENQNVDAALSVIALDPTSMRAFDRSISDAFEAGGNITAQLVPPIQFAEGLVAQFHFNVRNPAAERWLSEHSSKLITEIVADQRVLVREHLTYGMARGVNPRTSALDLVGRIGASGNREGGVIGLTSSQAQWARNYAEELATDPARSLSRALRDRRFDATVRRAVANETSIPASTQEAMVRAYRNRALRYRAETIARTEAMAALHEAQQQSMQQAIDSGAVHESDVSFVWHATEDERTRDSHAEMDGQVTSLGEPFVSGDGNQLDYPGDPTAPPEEVINCRCWVEPQVDFLAQAD